LTHAATVRINKDLGREIVRIVQARDQGSEVTDQGRRIAQVYAVDAC
jgi:hypothetical protein